MTQVVTVHTDFTDLNQMAQGLIGRVDPIKVILPGPEAVDAGEWVQFAITLQDGTPGFAGVGRCVTAVDNGEERSSHQRFDVVIDSLQFDSRGQQVFEHILSLSGYGADGQPAAAPVEDVNFEDFATEYTGSQIEVPDDAVQAVYSAAEAPEDEEDEDQGTMVSDGPLLSDSPLSLANDDEPVTSDGPSTFSDPPTGNLAAVPAAPRPSAPPQQNGAPKNGAMFAYTGGLPFPNVPPRPPIEPSQRVSPAPRPAKNDA